MMQSFVKANIKHGSTDTVQIWVNIVFGMLYGDEIWWDISLIIIILYCVTIDVK